MCNQNQKVKICKGDLIAAAFADPSINVIAHGCNCFCTMKSGIAAQIVKYFPSARNADKQTKSGDRTKLGTYSYAVYTISDDINGWRDLLIVNAYTQYAYGRNKLYFEYSAFEKLVKQFNIDFKGKTVAMPWIGCGLAGGDKAKVLEILNNNVKDFNCIIFEL